jgi:hypothetical protein
MWLVWGTGPTKLRVLCALCGKSLKRMILDLRIFGETPDRIFD